MFRQNLPLCSDYMHLHQGIIENFQIIAHQASGLIKRQFCSNMLQFYIYLLVIIIKEEKKYQSPGFELARYVRLSSGLPMRASLCSATPSGLNLKVDP